MKKPPLVRLAHPKANDSNAILSYEIQLIINKAKATKQEKMLRLPQVKQKISLAESTIWKGVKDRTLPPPVALGARAVAWRESELQAWIEVKVLSARSCLNINMPAFIISLTDSQLPSNINLTDGAQND